MNNEYIKRTDAITEINRGDLLVGNNAEWAREIIWRTPYSDVAPVQHGHWIEVKFPTGVEAFGYKEMMVVGFKCSLCKENIDVLINNAGVGHMALFQMTTIEEIRRIAIEELGMTYAKEGQVVMVSGEGSDYVRQISAMPE